MEDLNLGDSIAQLKVMKWQYDETHDLEPTIGKEVRDELIKNILNTIEAIEVPELISGYSDN